MFSILRTPDRVLGCTENTSIRFEEDISMPCPVKYDYLIENGVGKVMVYPSGSPVKYLKFRFRGDMGKIDLIYGDRWQRQSYLRPLVWGTIRPERCMPWDMVIKEGDKLSCYGVKTGPNAFCSWYVDKHGISLLVDVTNGNDGTDLQAPICACEVVELFGESGEDAFDVVKRFNHLMCDKPVMPKTPVFGVNNWYWAYGNISKKSVLTETDYLMEMTKGTVNQPYMIIDDGWQKHRQIGTNVYIGGEWEPNEKFGDMAEVAYEIHKRGAKAGLWFRPLLTREKIEGATYFEGVFDSYTLDASNPYVLAKIKADVQKFIGWGFDLVKHDFSGTDFTRYWDIVPDRQWFNGSQRFYDRTITNAMIIKGLYKAIQEGAGDKEVIGCSTFTHLVAGIHSMQRVGGDTSGLIFEITRSDGVNSMMRLPQNGNFYMIDPDCAGFTGYADVNLNLDFLEMCALTGVTTLASVKPGILTKDQMKRINEIYKIADKGNNGYTIKGYDKTNCPDTFVSPDGKTVKEYDWYSVYDGVRTKFSWEEYDDVLKEVYKEIK